MSDVPEELRLRVGEEHTIRLPSLATAGYGWQAAVDDERVATVSSRFEDDETKGAAKAASRRDEFVTVSGRTEGTTRLTLVQRRSWESEAESIAAHTLTVTVVAVAQQPGSEGRKDE